MLEQTYEIAKNEIIAKDTYLMILNGDTSEITRPGQFVNIKLEGFYLRRPISVCDKNDASFTIVYKTVGRGTRAMSEMKTGENLCVLTGLGNGFNTLSDTKFPLLIGGGAGCAPLLLLAKELLKEGKKPQAVLGFNSADEVFLTDCLKKSGVETFVSTLDGSCGTKGFVTDAIAENKLTFDYFYACGPEPMLKAVSGALDVSGELSFEERMGCGFGACMGCSCETKYGYKRICKDGPVLAKEEIVW